MNWDDENVRRAMDDYKQEKKSSLEDLTTTIIKITGIKVSKTTLSRRLRGISTQKSGGRPRKALLEKNNMAQPLFPGDVPSPSTNVYPSYETTDSLSHQTSVSPSHRTFESPDYRTFESPDYRTFESPDYRTFESPDYRTFESPDYRTFELLSPQSTILPSLQSTVLTSGTAEYMATDRSETMKAVLSNRLSPNVLTLSVGSGMVRQYCLTNRSKDGTTKFYRCTKCYSLYRKCKTGELAKVAVRNGIIPTEQPQHNPDCLPMTEAQVLAIEIDRECHKEVRNGHFAPREVYNKGHEMAVRLSQVLGDLRSANGVAASYKSWPSVRRQFGRHRAAVKPLIEDGFSLPDLYQCTLFGQISGDRERWLLLSCKKEGVLVFAADNDLRVAADCNTFVGDATFSTSPKGFRQLYILHAKVKGCLFHNIQAVLRQMRRKGLLRFYNGDFGKGNVIRRWIRHICALPLLPPELAWEMWITCLRNPPVCPAHWVAPKGFGSWPTVQMLAFSDYLEQYWFCEMPILWWNHWHSQTDRTTNAAEAFHSVLSKQSCAIRHPSLTNFFPWLQKIHCRQQTRLMQLQRGDKTRRKDRRYLKIDERLTKYKQELSEQLATSADLSSRVAFCERFIARCAYQLSDVDRTGLKTRKAAQAALAKVVLLRSQKVESCVKLLAKQKWQCVVKAARQCKRVLLDSAIYVLPSVTADVSTYLTTYDGAVIPMEITAHDFQSLAGTAWLNDVIIDAYLSLIDARSRENGNVRVYSFKTYLSGAIWRRGFDPITSKYTKNVDIFANDFILFPLAVNNHWILIVVNIQQKTLSFYNSIGGTGEEHLLKFSQYLQSESANGKNGMDISQFSLKNSIVLPRQLNGYDCGVFICQYAEHLTRSVLLNFSQTDMPQFRLQMRQELSAGRLNLTS